MKKSRITQTTNNKNTAFSIDSYGVVEKKKN